MYHKYHMLLLVVLLLLLLVCTIRSYDFSMTSNLIPSSAIIMYACIYIYIYIERERERDYN